MAPSYHPEMVVPAEWARGTEENQSHVVETVLMVTNEGRSSRLNKKYSKFGHKREMLERSTPWAFYNHNMTFRFNDVIRSRACSWSRIVESPTRVQSIHSSLLHHSPQTSNADIFYILEYLVSHSSHNCVRQMVITSFMTYQPPVPDAIISVVHCKFHA